MSSGKTNDTAPGAAIYKPSTLKLYDLVVLQFSNTHVWRCPTNSVLLPFFTQNLSQKHLDIGVGTGYYLRQSIGLGALNKSSKVTLVDLNPHTLDAAQNQLRDGGGIEAEQLVWDIMKPLPLRSADRAAVTPQPMVFDSISLYYLMHCMPGPQSAKTSIFAHLKHNLSHKGVLYGATILGNGHGVEHNFLGRFLMWVYNRKGVFGNMGDTEKVFVEALREHFDDVKTNVVGVVLLFRAQGVKRS